MKNTPEENLIRTIEAAYRKGSWHGPNLHAALRGIDARTALWRVAEGRHNIWELAIHAAYWKFAVRRKLLRERGLKFAFPGNNWFPVTHGSEREWAAARYLLDEQHKLLLYYLVTAAREIVCDPARNRLVTGVALHDVYHAGQIVLMKKLAASG